MRQRPRHDHLLDARAAGRPSCDGPRVRAARRRGLAAWLALVLWSANVAHAQSSPSASTSTSASTSPTPAVQGVPAVPVMRAVPLRAVQGGSGTPTPAVAPPSASTTPDSRSNPSAARDVDVPKRLDEASKAAIEATLARSSPDLAAYDELYRTCVGKSGEATLLLKELDAIDSDKSNDDPRRFAARAAAAYVLRREGRNTDALARIDAALALVKTESLLLERAHVLDALDRIPSALEAYGKVLETCTDPSRIAHVRLRVALLETSRAEKNDKKNAAKSANGAATSEKPAGGAATSGGLVEEDSALFTFASSRADDRELQNRSAVVSALIGRPREAIRLYQAAGEGTDRFRQEVRLAEWSLLAEAPVEAQEHAWNARAAATLKRDRLYALVVLVEAHRADDSLPKLVERFAAEPDLDDESRHVWIDLLRELSRVDEAMALFAKSARGGFTPEMRRELLEMCREAGRDAELVETYGKLITEEPDRVEWREGLSRYHLEAGRRDEARAVWTSFVEVNGSVQRWMQAAQATRDLGLEDLARASAERCLADPVGNMEARLFLYDMEARRGHTEAALEQLEAFDRSVPADAPQRIQLAEAFERIGDKKRAVKILEGVRAVRGAENAEEDLEMRLAWLLSETGDEKRALDMWRNLWRRVDSLSRRRQVEDRLMATASRLGVLADIAVDLEDKLARGQAEDRDAALLVRLYGKVGDPVSAAEVLEEHMKQKGGDELAVLEEKARIYLGGKDYYHFEKTVRRLIDVDPERKSDHLRQLAMSQLERGKPTEAREVLRRLAECENPTDAAEFEAGVLALAGLHDEAARTYRRGLAQHPERIDGYLLLGNALNGLQQTERAIGMFQFLAETADRDDLFTVAIDGILNMRAKEPVLRWARRVTLERIAQRHDKMYLYQLYTDLSEELNDTPAVLRALETSLAIAGEQRSSVLRQLMEASQGKADNSYVVVNGVLVARRSGGESKKRLAYGRRLIGLGDLVPPQVYLELGESFLAAGEVANASKTFSMARDVPDYPSFRRQVAASFESAGFAEQALSVYERAMASESLDVGLLIKTAAIHEQLGRDARASALYARGIEVLLAQHALTGSGAKAAEKASPFDWSAKNMSDFDRYFSVVVAGFSASSGDATARTLFDAQRALLDADLTELDRTPVATGETRTLASCPRVRHRSQYLRDTALTMGWVDDAEAIDVAVLRRFAADADALDVAVEARKHRGLARLATRLVDRAPSEAALKESARVRLGAAGEARAGAPRIGLPEVVGQLVPLLIDGDADRLSLLLRRLQMGEAKKEDLPYVQLLVSAAAYMRDETSVVTLAGYALRVLAVHAEGWEDTQRATALLERVRKVVSPAAFDVIVDGFVTQLSEDDKRLEQFQYVITQLQEKLGRPLLTVDAVRKRLEQSLPDGEYMLPELVALVPVAQRGELVRGVWDKVPATSRARVALELLTSNGPTPLPPELVATYLEFYDGGLESVTELRMIVWGFNNLLDSENASPETTAHVLDRAAKKWTDDATIGFLRCASLRKRGDTANALEALRRALATPPKNPDDYYVRNAAESVVTAWGSEHAEELLAELERIEAETGTNDVLDDLLSNVLEQVGDADKRRAVLDRTLARSPEKPEVLRRVYYDAQRAGDTSRMIDMLERLMRVDKRNGGWRNQLVALWTRLANPIRALATRQDGETVAKKVDVEKEAKRLPPATIEAVKKAVDAGQMAEARSLYRRTWRTFGDGDSRFGRVVYYSGSRAGAQLWPTDAVVKEEAEKAEPRGGLDDLAKRLEEFDRERAEQKTRDASKGKPRAAGDVVEPAAEKRATVYEAVAQLPFGEEELARQVRSLDASQLQTSRPLLQGLGQAQVKRLGQAEAVRQWSSRLHDGTASLVDRSLLLSYLEDHLDELTEEDRASLSDIAAAVHPLDTAQLRGLARIHAHLSNTDRALRIYEWCATLATSRRWYFDSDDAPSASDLIAEVRQQLTGPDRERAVLAILESADPGEDDSERDSHEALVLRTWLDMNGAQDALARCREALDRVCDPKQGLHRETAAQAARILAETGDTSRALRCLEIATCKLEEADVKVPPGSRGSLRWLLQARGMDNDEIASLLTVEAGSTLDPVAWCRAVVERVVAWERAGRLAPGTSFTFVGIAVLRLRQLGANDAAAECVRALADLPHRTRALDLLLADLHRALGQEAQANALEDALLADRRLPPVRVHEVVSRVRRSQGDAAAFALAEQAADWTLHPKLLDQLVELSDALQKPDRKSAWESTREAASAARKRLETP